MWKTALTLFIFLVSLISGVLFYHWDTYSEINLTSEVEQIEQVETIITIKSNENNLSINQLFSGLMEDKEYRIFMPEMVEDWSCIKGNGEICDSYDDNPLSFLAENGMLNIVYELNLPSDDKPFLLQNFTSSLTGYETLRTEIQIIDQGRRQGTWVAGLPLRGFSEQELIDYYVFEGTYMSPSLYWQPQPLLIKKNDNGLYFYSANEPTNIEMPVLDMLGTFDGMTIVMTNDYNETNGRGLMIVKPEITDQLLQRKIVYNYFYGKGKDFSLEEMWLFDVLTALLTEENSLVERGQLFIEQLKGQLTKDEINQFMLRVIGEKAITPQRLDEILGSVVGKKTRYFALNSNEETTLLPLYFYDGRKVLIDETLDEEIEVLHVDDKKLFPFVETLQALGFEVKVLADEETILINKDTNSYRFFVGQNIFIYNQEDYGLLSNPLTILNGKIYTEVGWLQTIFKVVITETEEDIILQLNY